MTEDAELRVEATGETVGEAKWHALRELEQRAPGLDKAAVRFEVVSEGERGLLGVGYAPARVIASVDADAVSSRARRAAGRRRGRSRRLLRELLDARSRERPASAAGSRSARTTRRSRASLVGGDLGLLIGRHGQTIDAIQYLANVIAWRELGEGRKDVVVDAAGYRERRRETLEALALRSAERARSSGESVDLEPMSSIERRIVHLRLKEVDGVSTRSEGEEPYRYVVVEPE